MVGAHALGFNTGSVGIALIGTYETTQPSKAAQDALARLIAWRLDVAHVDPTSFLTYISGGSERYASGIPVLLNAVSGHRDTGYTECPGDALYAKLGTWPRRPAPSACKIFEPRSDVDGAAVRFRARLSSTQPWSVVVTSAGSEIASGSGVGTSVDWTWDSTGAPAGSFAWTIGVDGARSVTGIVHAGGGSAPLAIEAASTDPEAISPNGDEQAETSLLTYRLNVSANVTVQIVDSIGGVITTPTDRVWTHAGQHTLVIDGSGLPDGSYSVVITARTVAGAMAQKIVPLTVNRTLGVVAVSPTVFSPNGDGRKDRLVLTFSLAAPADVRIRIVRSDRWVASPFAASFLPGAQRLVWDGVRSSGVIRDGATKLWSRRTGWTQCDLLRRSVHLSTPWRPACASFRAGSCGSR